MDWYYAENGQQKGPVTQETFDSLVEQGTVTPKTLVWHEGLSDWLPYQQLLDPSVPPLPSAANTDPQPAIPSVETSVDEPHYAGFWIRVGAKLVDRLLMMFLVVICIILFKVPIPDFANPNLQDLLESEALKSFQYSLLLFSAVIGVLFNTLFIAYFQATPGKMLCQIRVIAADGTDVSFWRAFGRGCCELINEFIYGVGYIIAAFDRQKRALHDHVCGTRVVYRFH